MLFESEVFILIEDIIFAFIVIFSFPAFIGSIAFICYKLSEQEHRHQIELEKAKQGIFESDTQKPSFFKKYGMHLLFVTIFTCIIVVICYIFKVPTDLTKYILELVK